MNRLLLSLFVICISTVSCNSQPSATKDSIALPITHKYELPKLFRDSTNKFTISFPESWQTKQNFMGCTVMGFGEAIFDKNSTMKQDGAFSVGVSDLGKEYSSLNWFKGNMIPLKRDYPDFKIIEQTNLDIDGVTGYYVCHSLTENGKQVTNIQIYFTIGRIGYILNGSATSQEFKNYRDLYLEIARTFKIIK